MLNHCQTRCFNKKNYMMSMYSTEVSSMVCLNRSATVWILIVDRKERYEIGPARHATSVTKLKHVSRNRITAGHHKKMDNRSERLDRGGIVNNNNLKSSSWVTSTRKNASSSQYCSSPTVMQIWQQKPQRTMHSLSP